jgi:ABC-type glycerol-3-phosphate transport system substrate-binding protein
MKAMKPATRLLSVSMASVLLAGAIAACTPTAPTAAPATQPPAEEPTTALEPTTAPEPTAAVEPTEGTAPEGEQITLRYANWNVGTEEENNVQRQLVAAYMDANPNVTIEFVDMSGEGGWDGLLTAYAARGELPDVFMANNVPLYVQNGWLADLSDLTAADADWQNVPQVLRDSFTYDGRVMGVPSGQFIMGYFVNQDLYEEANLDAPAYGFTLDEFNEGIAELTDIQGGRLGLDESGFVLGWYPNAIDPTLGWFSFDGANMNYDSDAFKDAVARAGEVRQYSWTGLTEEQKANFRSVGPWELFLNQEVAVRWDGGWVLPDFVSKAEFNWDFIGIPGGNQALVADAIVVSATTPDVAAAYDFARWMSFSSEAYTVEADLARAAGTAPKMPVTVTDETIALYTVFVDKPGVIAALNNLDNSIVESLAKIVPGYINARWEGRPGIAIGEEQDASLGFIFDNVNSDLFQYTDYSARLEEFANAQLEEARDAVTP